MRFFGRLRDAAGADEIERDVPPQVVDSEAMRQWLGAEFPAWLEPTVRIAIDDVLTTRAVPIAEASEAAFLPPVSGG